MKEILEVSVYNKIESIVDIEKLTEYVVFALTIYSECLVWIMYYARTLYQTFETI